MSSFITPSFEKKICEPLLLDSTLENIPRPIVFTNGCFDILHRGHVTYLSQARNLGKSLIVAVNTDESIRALSKSKGNVIRPITPLGDRVSILAAIGSISLVTWFDETTPIKLIEKIRPEILAKGGDWEINKIIGAEFVKSYNGSVVSIPFNYKRSTTEIINKIFSAKI